MCIRDRGRPPQGLAGEQDVWHARRGGLGAEECGAPPARSWQHAQVRDARHRELQAGDHLFAQG
eukprot:4802050-Alexandrium_andersonii.AAC.1